MFKIKKEKHKHFHVINSKSNSVSDIFSPKIYLSMNKDNFWQAQISPNFIRPRIYCLINYKKTTG